MGAAQEFLQLMEIPEQILSALTEKKIEIGEPKIRHGKAILQLAFSKIECANDLKTATPIFDVINVIKPESKPRKPRAAKQPKPEKK